MANINSINNETSALTITPFLEGALITSSTGVVSTVTGTSGYVLTANTAGTAPSFQALATSITTIEGDSGSVTGSTVSIKANGSSGAGKTVAFTGSGTAMSFTVTDGSANTLIGLSAGTALTSGINNIALGQAALTSLQNGQYNVAIGAAFTSLTSGTVNIGLGQGAGGSVSTGSGNVAIGNNAGSSWGAGSASNIAINSPAASESNTLRLGTATGTGGLELNATYICGIDGRNVGSVAKVVTMASDRLGTATITAGAGITVTPSANTITITASGGGFTWTDATNASYTVAAANGYVANRGTLVTFTLPTNNALGDTIKIVGKGSGGWTIVYGTNQNIVFGASTTTTTTGSLSSSLAADCVELVCTTASATVPIFTVVSSVGNLTVV